MPKNNDTEKIFKNLVKNLDFKKERRVFSKHFGAFVWLVVRNANDIPDGLMKIEYKACKFYRGPKKNKKACVSCISKVIQDAELSKHVEKFRCPGGLHGFVCPVVHGEKIYGYVIVCQLVKEPSRDILDIFAAFTETVINELHKELELQKLYETIRPRAIALSTVHTLHRLISSTLNLNELLPRVARLSLQIIRANRCSIKLLDSKKKILLPKTTIDLRKKKTKLKKVRIGKYAPGRAVKYSRPIRGTDFLAVPLIDEDVAGVITLYDKIDGKAFNDFDEEIMKTFCEQAVIAIKNAQLYKEQEKLTMGAIKSIAAILETKSPGTLLPKESFLRLVHLIGQELKLSEYELKSLQYAAILHDAGQIALPDKVMKKKGMLTGREYKLIKEHPRKAAMILKPLKQLKSVVPIILHHHENYDGSGYPSGLRKHNIPLGARIMGVVGSFEAMIAKKTYRKSFSIPQAINEIKKNAGRQFDPRVVEAFLNVITRKGVIKKLKKEIYGDKKSGK